MRTARSSSRPGGGGLHQVHPLGPGTAPDQAHTPGTRPPRTRHPPGPGPLPDQTPPHAKVESQKNSEFCFFLQKLIAL